jgi:threonine dehydrogenase-like Zn-dependent dehydrogenase
MWRRNMIQLLPSVLGHEFAGVVAATAPDVVGWTEGDRVRVHPTLSCRACEFCTSEREPMCGAVSLMGHTAYSPAAMPLYERYHNGGLAQYVKVPAWSLDRVPANVSIELASRVHSMGVAYRALRKAQLGAGSTLIVNAATGAAGGTVVRFARTFGATRVIAVGRSRANLERTKSWDSALIEIVALDGLPAGWDERDGLLNRIQTLTGGRGADALVDFTPAESVATVQAIRSLRKGGVAVLSGGNYGEMSGLRYGDIMRGQWRIEGNQGYARSDARAVLRLLESGAVQLDDMITHRVPLAEAMRAVSLIETREGAPLYIVIEPQR